MSYRPLCGSVYLRGNQLTFVLNMCRLFGGIMTLLTLAFEEDLRIFLTPAQRHGGAFELEVDGSPSIKDVVESAGVPHTEPDCILVNKVSVPYSYLVRDGDQIEVYSVRTA